MGARTLAETLTRAHTRTHTRVRTHGHTPTQKETRHWAYDYPREQAINQISLNLLGLPQMFLSGVKRVQAVKASGEGERGGALDGL